MCLTDLARSYRKIEELFGVVVSLVGKVKLFESSLSISPHRKNFIHAPSILRCELIFVQWGEYWRSWRLPYRPSGIAFQWLDKFVGQGLQDFFCNKWPCFIISSSLNFQTTALMKVKSLVIDCWSYFIFLVPEYRSTMIHLCNVKLVQKIDV